MDKILKRDEFINEVYNPMMEQKKYEELKMVNEGLLKTLFGMAKNLFKKDWGAIKGDPSIIKAYKELDDSLTGFTTMKLSKKGECNKIRQQLVDFASDWYDMKMEQAKKEDRDPKPAKSMKFKDETLKSNLEETQKKIKELAGDDEQMAKWADTLLKDMKLVINRSILADIKNEEVKKELEKKNAEDAKKREEINKVVEEWQNKELEDIKKEREELISNAEASAYPEELLGGKVVQNVYGEFEKIQKAAGVIIDEKGDTKDGDTINIKDVKDLFTQDTILGLKSIFKEDKSKKIKDNDLIGNSYRLMSVFYTQLNKDMDKFKEVPGQSVQSMCIGINAFIKNCIFSDPDYGGQLELMSKCAVVSDGVVSYNLPLNDKTGDEAGNYFTDSVNLIITTANNKKDDWNINDDFDKNAKNLFDKIKSEAEKLKEDTTKRRNESLKGLKFPESDNNE